MIFNPKSKSTRPRFLLRATFVVGVALANASSAGTKFNVVDFAPSAALPELTDDATMLPATLPRSFHFNTDDLTLEVRSFGLPTGISYSVGQAVNQSSGPSVAVFAFDSINVSLPITAQGSRALVILSHGDASLTGDIDVSGGDSLQESQVPPREYGQSATAENFYGGLPGPGAGAGGGGWLEQGQLINNMWSVAPRGQGTGGGADGLDSDPGFWDNSDAGQGGGFGGMGGKGLNNPDRYVGGTYGDLTAALHGGSGGGAGSIERFNATFFELSVSGAGGGGGGGAIELGAIGNLTVSTVIANGGNTTDGDSFGNEHGGNGGGGSGGGIRLHGNQVTIVDQVMAHGGSGYTPDEDRPGGGGGGGRVLIDARDHVIENRDLVNIPTLAGIPLESEQGTINVKGGAGYEAGSHGTAQMLFTRLVVRNNTSRWIDGGGTTPDRLVPLLELQNGLIDGFAVDENHAYDVLVKEGNTTLRLMGDPYGRIKTVELLGNGSKLYVEDAASTVERVIGIGTLRLDAPLTMTKGDNGEFVGDVLINTHLVYDSDTNYTISGELSGTGTLTKQGAGTLTISGQSNKFMGAILLENGSVHLAGDIEGFGTFDIRNGTQLNGSGLLTGDVTVRPGGTIAPGDGAGSLTLRKLTLETGARMQFELGGTAAVAEYDQMTVTGAVTLAGVVKLSLLGDYTPAFGERLTIMTGYASRTGKFDSVQGVTTPDGLRLAVLYEAGGVVVTPTLPGDANVDGLVSIGDLTILADHFNGSGGWADGDFNGDGSISIGDLTLMADNFGFSAGGPVALSAIPLPGACWAGLALLGLAGAGRRRR